MNFPAVFSHFPIDRLFWLQRFESGKVEWRIQELDFPYVQSFIRTLRFELIKAHLSKERLDLKVSN